MIYVVVERMPYEGDSVCAAFHLMYHARQYCLEQKAKDPTWFKEMHVLSFRGAEQINDEEVE